MAVARGYGGQVGFSSDHLFCVANLHMHILNLLHCIKQLQAVSSLKSYPRQCYVSGFVLFTAILVHSVAFHLLAAMKPKT